MATGAGVGKVEERIVLLDRVERRLGVHRATVHRLMPRLRVLEQAARELRGGKDPAIVRAELEHRGVRVRR